MGIFAYKNIPKEMFPVVSLDSIEVSGSYSGASADSLNNFAVVEIENQIDTIAGIQEVSTTVTNGSFSISIELQDGTDQQTVKDEVEDAISSAQQYFPSDMTTPTVTNSQRQMSLLNISLSSATKTKKELLDISDSVKTKLLQIANVSEVNVFGDSDLEIEIILDEKKINTYGLNADSVANAIENFSYIYPVGEINQKGNHVYLSANNNKFDKEVWLNTIIKVDDKKVYLKDIATVNIDYPIDDTISRLNGNTTISLRVYSSTEGDSIAVSDSIKMLISQIQSSNNDLIFSITRDSSKPLTDRIKTIIANVTLGLILVALCIHFLISTRLSFVIVMGIPFSFILSLLLIEQTGYSLNMISMMAMLICLGIVVDDAIVVSENIQRHLDDGEEVNQAVIKGTKEMIAPVLIASFTTIFAFLPMLLISGEMGILMKLVPIVVTVMIFSSLIESFLFLPLHSKHILKRKDKMFDWTPLYNFYEKILHKVVYYKKSFLLLFFVSIPLITFFLISQSRFQMMPDMDSRNVTLSFKLDDSKSLEESDAIVKKYEKVLLENKEKLFIDNIDTTVGRFTNLVGNGETTENSFTLTLELYDQVADNFLEKYINPVLNLSFDFAQVDKKRTTDVSEAKAQIRALVEPLVQQDNVVEFNVVSSRIGIVKTDIELKLSNEDKTLLIEGINTLKKALAKIDGVIDISDNTNLGEKEYKFTLNSYALSLGLSDSEIATQLKNYFTEKEQANTYNNDGIIKIITQSVNKDNLEDLKHFLINIDSQKIELQDLVSFTIEQNFEKIEKENGIIQKNVYANVEKQAITANEALKMIEPTLAGLREKGILVSFGGEREKSEQMQSDMIKAFIVALFLIFITLLVNFPSFKSAFIILSVIPFTVLGALVGHFVMGINLNSQSFIGMMGLAGVVINDGIIMLDFLHDTTNKKEFFQRAKQRVRPILITSITTILGLATLIFFPTGQSVMLQPIAISLGFGIAWGTILNLFYVPALYATFFKIKD
jgi:multidrug efflux pump subunit AcrB